jgi:PAS domain S-box-containing protein
MAPRAKRHTTTRASRPLSDVDIACQALVEIKRQLKTIASVGGGKPSADLLVAAVDDCVEAVIVSDDAAEIQIVNGAAARLTGLSTRELQSSTVWDISDPATQVSFDVLWKEFLRAGRQRGTYTIRNQSGGPVEVAYCAEAHVLPGRHVSVLRKRAVA